MNKLKAAFPFIASRIFNSWL